MKAGLNQPLVDAQATNSPAAQSKSDDGALEPKLRSTAAQAHQYNLPKPQRSPPIKQKKHPVKEGAFCKLTITGETGKITTIMLSEPVTGKLRRYVESQNIAFDTINVNNIQTYPVSSEHFLNFLIERPHSTQQTNDKDQIYQYLYFALRSQQKGAIMKEEALTNLSIDPTPGSKRWCWL